MNSVTASPAPVKPGRTCNYASGVLTPAWVPEQDTEHGGTVLRPALVNLPIDSGENPMPNGWSSPDANTLSVRRASPSLPRRTRMRPGSDSTTNRSPFGAI